MKVYTYKGTIWWTIGLLLCGIGMSIMFTKEELKEIGEAIKIYLNSEISNLEK